MYELFSWTGIWQLNYISCALYVHKLLSENLVKGSIVRAHTYINKHTHTHSLGNESNIHACMYDVCVPDELETKARMGGIVCSLHTHVCLICSSSLRIMQGKKILYLIISCKCQQISKMALFCADYVQNMVKRSKVHCIDQYVEYCRASSIGLHCSLNALRRRLMRHLLLCWLPLLVP